MRDFFELGNALISAKKVANVELNDDSIGVTYENGKYVYKSFSKKEAAEKAYSAIKSSLCETTKPRSYVVSYFWTDGIGGTGVGLDCFEDVREKLTANAIRRFSETIEKSHSLKTVSIMGVIPLEG